MRTWLVAGTFALAVAGAALHGSEPPQPPDPVVPELLAAMRGANDVTCELAGMALGNGWLGGGNAGIFGDARVHEVIAAVVQRDVMVRELPALRDGLADADPCVARTAGRLLGRARTPEAVAALRAAVRTTGSARLPAIIGLAHAEDHAATADLRPLLRDGDAQVRRATAWALGMIEDPAATADLVRLLEADTDATVRRAAAWALGRME